MKQLLPAILLLSFLFTACRKDKATTPDPPPDYVDTIGTGPEQTGSMTIKSIAPASGLPNTVVTISGTNFGTTATGLTVRFNGVEATIQSVTPKEIKVLVPVTTSGSIVIISGNNYVTGPVFTYLFPELNAPYTSGDVTLHNQAEVDAFVALNKGRQLQINGSLFIGAANLVSSQSNDITSLDGLSIITSVTGQVFFYKINLPEAAFLNTITSAGSISIYSCAFTSLSFAKLNSFSGSLSLNDLTKLGSVSLRLQPSVEMITISLCPLLTDLSFLSNIVTARSVMLSSTGATSIACDQLTTVRNGVSISGNSKLTSVSFQALTTIGDPTAVLQGGSVTVSYSPLLSGINFSNLTSFGGKLTLRGVNIKDMTGFHSLNRIGGLLLDGNPSLTDLHGLEQLTSLTLTGVISSSIGGSSAISRVNGVYISNNARLASLNGLQHLSTIPIAYITGNPLLNDLCPFKASANTLSKLPAYSYKYTDQLGRIRTASVAALTLTNNGNYTTTADALAAVALCQ